MKPLLLLLLLPILCALVFPLFLHLFIFNVHDDELPSQPIARTPQSLSLLKHRPHLQQQLEALPAPSSRSLLSLSSQPTTALIATLDGTMYLVDRQESGSTRVIWSFSTGSPIYRSYQATINHENGKENTSKARISGFVECGDDWALYMHDKHFGKMRISESIAEYVARTPTFSDDGAVTLGSKRSTLYEVDVKTGRIIQIHAMSDFDSASVPWSDDKKSFSNTLTTKKKDLADPAKLKSPQQLLKIFRTDYSLQSVGPSSGAVLWTMTVAEFDAVLLCNQTSFDAAEDEHTSESGLNFAMPYPCQEQEIKQVIRLQKNFLLESSVTERLPRAYHENDMLPMPTSNLMLPSQPNVDKFLNAREANMMLPVPAPEPSSLPALKLKNGYYNSDNNADMLHQLLTEITTPKEVYLSRMNGWSLPEIVLIMVFLLGLGFSIIYYLKSQAKLKDQNQSELKISPAKKKKTRRSGKNSGMADKMENHLPSEDEEVLAPNDIQNDAESWLHFNQFDQGVDGRRIGKLFVLNKEIAKGSNGTIVFEGRYEGRAVAVKRLVRAHHDVAYKEIQNLSLSDRHQNIVRLYGVEHDQDFVYIALEQCTCSLDDLIISESPLFGKNQTFRYLVVQDLWKANGYPSPLLLKLMRDVVSGVVHLHELGIVHRDLKPQNVLITKERFLCAKLSDMGISKRLHDDMSSLAHNATGGGSSGWQAPEQLVQARQTRAVDLFSLGCVLFFCLTGGSHPFGKRFERDVNIMNNQKDLFLVEFFPEAEDLITRLLNPDPDMRPKAIEVLRHPFFWSSEKRLSFLRDTSDRVELEDRGTSSNLLNALESIGTTALGAKWDEKMESVFLNNIGRYRRYKFDSVRDLLRVMRNKLNHYRELPQEIQELVGSVPDGFNHYFASRFPRLLIDVYKVVCDYCKEEECFQRYFRNVD